MYSNNFIPTITRPTRSISSTLIDNIYTNNIDGLMSTTHGILICDITDHFPIFNIIAAIEDSEIDLYSYRRIINCTNKHIFKDLVANANWENIFSYNDTQSAFTAFHSKLVTLYDQTFPKKRIKLTYRTKKPWLTEGLKISNKRTNALYKLLKQYDAAYNEMQYKLYKNKVTKLISLSEKQHLALWFLWIQATLEIPGQWLNRLLIKQETLDIVKISLWYPMKLSTLIKNDNFVNVGPHYPKALQMLIKHHRNIWQIK